MVLLLLLLLLLRRRSNSSICCRNSRSLGGVRASEAVSDRDSSSMKREVRVGEEAGDMLCSRG